MVRNGGSVKVAFLGSTGRSGSTLVSRALGAAPGTCSVGELCWIWNYGVLRNRPCGCGRPFRDCDFWQNVAHTAFGAWDRIDAERLNGIRRSLVATRSIPKLWTIKGPRADPDVREYLDAMDVLYRAIAEVSGASVIVDNSKQVPAALLARAVPGVDLRLLHLVRSPYGVAYSWTKHVSRGDNAGEEMRRRYPARTALRWSLDNVLFELMESSGTPRLMLHYEEFVRDPRQSSERVLRFLDEPSKDLSFVGPDWVELGPDHSVWGNPMRERVGRETLRVDQSWRRGLPARDRVIVGALAGPAAFRYDRKTQTPHR